MSTSCSPPNPCAPGCPRERHAVVRRLMYALQELIESGQEFVALPPPRHRPGEPDRSNAERRMVADVRSLLWVASAVRDLSDAAVEGCCVPRND